MTENINKEEIIYKEINESRRLQGEEYNLLSQKIYWLLALNIAIITTLIITSLIYHLSILMIGLAIIISVFSLWSVKYRRGLSYKKLRSNCKKYDGTKFLQEINNKLSKAIEENQVDINNKARLLKIALFFTLLGIGMLFIFFIY